MLEVLLFYKRLVFWFNEAPENETVYMKQRQSLELLLPRSNLHQFISSMMV